MTTMTVVVVRVSLEQTMNSQENIINNSYYNNITAKKIEYIVVNMKL